MSMQSLIGELCQAFLIGEDDELLKLQVRAPQLNNKENGHELLLIGG
jgi:hypothetical protein